MNRRPIFYLVVAIGIIGAVMGVVCIKDAIQSRRYFIRIATASAGYELIAATNVPRWIQVGPELRAELSDLQASPTHISKVLLGDEQPPVGNGRAASRLILTNELGRGLAVRLRLRHNPSQVPIFDVLSYWKITAPLGPADGSQPLRSETNRTPVPDGFLRSP